MVRARDGYSRFCLRNVLPDTEVSTVYNKINGIEPNVSAELVRYSAAQLEQVIGQFGVTKPEVVPGYQVKICDGNAKRGDGTSSGGVARYP